MGSTCQNLPKVAKVTYGLVVNHKLSKQEVMGSNL